MSPFAVGVCGSVSVPSLTAYRQEVLEGHLPEVAFLLHRQSALAQTAGTAVQNTGRFIVS